ncbi:hypothetical protein XINFAN_03432 [Pseudogemmobacter humi]|uniref:SGNH hydrolase-type esterase domain-containing protein n=2 Tax=Pseudogemmobacter humi TaxID=2483812 RepID=A0A3P5XPB7_9RHOB|nr:hypothetical protein XINFAN_03432 [Pseudogemmobacter humi]
MGVRVRMAVWIGFGAVVLAALALAAWKLRAEPRFAPGAGLDAAERARHYPAPLPPPDGPVRVYHLGHSLTGRDMPAMLAQLAGHDWNSQLGWGASLDQHWRGEVPGFAEENAAPVFRPAHEAAGSGDYPVFVLTEMIGLADAIRWHDSPAALARWVQRIREGRADARIYLYETWHPLDEAPDWPARLEADLPGLWEAHLLRPVLESGERIHVIPGGQVMAAVAREAEAGRIPGLSGAGDLFGDDIHFNDLGAWLVAQTHYAVIYGRSPLGLPARLNRADGSPADAPPDEAVRIMQGIVWRVVTSYPPTGVGGE